MPDTVRHIQRLKERIQAMEGSGNNCSLLDLGIHDGSLALIESQWERISLIDSKFQSGNSVEVDRIVITREEWFGGDSD